MTKLSLLNLGHVPAVTLTTTEEIDISRGDMIVHKDKLPYVSKRLKAKIVWMDEKALVTNNDYYIKFPTKMTNGHIDMFHYKIDINDLNEIPCGKLELNEIGLVDISLADKVSFDNYNKNRATGAFIIIDKLTNVTVGAGMIDEPLITIKQNKLQHEYSAFEIELNELVRRHFPHWGAKNILSNN